MNAPVLRTLLICDLADSTAMVQKLGDRRAADLMRRHDRISRDLLQLRAGREIDKTDGFLMLFERPIEAVTFALEYQRHLRDLGEEYSIVLQARVGIHVGDVILWENEADDIARGAKHLEVEGIAKSVAARLMGVARPGQILASGIAHTLAQRAHSELADGHNLIWRAHGSYRFKGLHEPIQIYEVGEHGATLFKAPAWSGKAYREMPWWRRPWTLAIEVLTLLAALAVPLYFSLRSPAAIAFGERDWVVVGDLKNQTGQSILDDSLQTAFRISLEQSRYVNLLPILQISDALKRMGKTASTRIDRALGAEIAIREGARALILPSVAEVGGHVRVTAEVVDPHTQKTVYAETADGTGLESILPSIGAVSAQLRARLGEALGAVQTNNAPLPRVTTPNLDALRAYSIGLQAYAKGQKADALNLFQQAIKLDPDFALAYMGMARVYNGTEDAISAAQAIKKAASLRERLPARDQLYLDAWIAISGPPEPMLKKWQVLGQVYPDYYAAAYNTAYFEWHLENRASAAIEAIKPALSDHNPLQGESYYTRAYLEVAENQFDAANEDFATAKQLGIQGEGESIVAAYGAQRRFDEAVRALNALKPTGFPTSDIYTVVERTTLELDQGNWQLARTTAQTLVDTAIKIDPVHGRVYRATQLSLEDYVAPKAAQRTALKALIAEARTAMDDNSDPNHVDEVFVELVSAYLAARAGDPGLAKAALDTARPYARGSGYPNLEHMLAIGEAEVALRGGRADDAIAGLEPTVDGTELFLTHVALADAYTAAGRLEDALKQATWLTTHRGRAYMETNSMHLLQARNVAESSLAMLRIAELNARLAKREAQDQALDDFLATWPQAAQLAFVAPRLTAIKDLSPL